MTEDKSRWIRQQLLTFLRPFPRKLQQPPPGAERFAADIAMRLGNCLTWCQSLDDGPQLHQPLDADAESIAALAEQLKCVGRQLWDGKTGRSYDSLREVESQLHDVLGLLNDLLARRDQ